MPQFCPRGVSSCWSCAVSAERPPRCEVDGARDKYVDHDYGGNLRRSDHEDMKSVSRPMSIFMHLIQCLH